MRHKKGDYQPHNNTRQADNIGDNLVLYVNNSYGEEGCTEDKVDEIV